MDVAPRRGSKHDMAGGEVPVVPVAAVDEKGEIIPEISTLASTVDPRDPDEPTEEEKQTLRKVSDKLPWSAFLVALIELCERFTYYGLSGPFQNYIQNPASGGATDVPGAIGAGQQEATGLVSLLYNSFRMHELKPYAVLGELLPILVLCYSYSRRDSFRPIPREI